MARAAGLAGEQWSRWTMSDAVQEAIETAPDAFDSDAIEAAFLDGRRELRAKTWRVCWTTAPDDYDNGGTETLETCGAWHNRTLRKVAIEPESYVYQTARYGSGLHPAWDEDPRVTEAAMHAKIAAENVERDAREAKRAAGLVWLKTATEDELDDFDTFEARGCRFDDVKAERKRREVEDTEKNRTEEWARCLPLVPEGATIIDPGEPAVRGTYGIIPGRPAHVYYSVRIVRGWPDDADHANVMGEGNDNAGSLVVVAEWLEKGRMRIAAPGEVPPRAVVVRIGHDRVKDIRRAEVGGKVVWVGSATWGNTMVLDENGHLVRSKKLAAEALSCAK